MQQKRMTSVEMDVEIYVRAKQSGIKFSKLIEMGLNSVNERKEYNEHIEHLENNIDKMQRRLSSFYSKLQEVKE